MVCRPGLVLIFGFLVAGCTFGQIGFPGQFPGQYPGGGYPGGSSIPFPGRGRANPQNNQGPITTFNGILRRVEAGDIVVQSDDKRIVTISFSNATRFYKASGGSGRLRDDFDAGDRVSVDATQDNNDYYHATRVTQISVGTSDERAAALGPLDTPVDTDNGRPRLSGAANKDNTQSTSTVAPPPSDPNDSGPPVLRRGTPANSSTQIADATSRPTIHADDVNGVTRPPAPPKLETNEPAAGRLYIPRSGDAVIDQAREAAFSFAETLPNYVVKQFTTRYETEAARGGQTSWRAIDNVTADVVSEDGKESYKNILVNGKPPREAVEKSGSWSTGEYQSVLLDILQPATNADFRGKRSTTIVNRAAYRYDFSVEQPNSHWHVHAGDQSYQPEYAGAIWIDKENFRVLRIELEARNMPRGFALDTVESAVDYDYVVIGGDRFLLPVHSEALSCERGTSLCDRNVIDFRNYKKFGADTSITFEPTP
jgi:hypothetical protein